MSDQPLSENERAGIEKWVKRHPKTVAALCFLLLVVLALYALNAKAERGLARRIAAIKAKGEPTTVNDLVALRSRLPDDQNMITQLLERSGTVANLTVPDDKRALIPLEGTAISVPTGRVWPHKQLEASQWYLRQVADDLRRVHDALRLERGILNVDLQDSSYPLGTKSTVLLPLLTKIRGVLRVLGLEAGVAAEMGDQARAGLILNEMSHVRAWSGSEAPLITALTEMASNVFIEDRIERTVNRCGLPADTLRQLQRSVHTLEASPDLKGVFLVERVFFLDYVAYLRSGKASPSLFAPPGTNPSVVWRHLPAVSAWDAALGLDAQSQIVDAIDGPTGTTLAGVQALAASPALNAWYAVYSRILLPSQLRAVFLWVRAVGQTRAMEAALACELYRLENGRWPAKLGELVPTLLERVPTDPVDGKAIRYAEIPEGIKTWTIIDDYGKRDDGGDVRRLEPYDANIRPKDYGWVILNPELRGRPATTQEATSGPARP